MLYPNIKEGFDAGVQFTYTCESDWTTPPLKVVYDLPRGMNECEELFKKEDTFVSPPLITTMSQKATPDIGIQYGGENACQPTTCTIYEKGQNVKYTGPRASIWDKY